MRMAFLRVDQFVRCPLPWDHRDQADLLLRGWCLVLGVEGFAHPRRAVVERRLAREGVVEATIAEK